MKASELLARIQELVTRYGGNVEVFAGDMNPVGADYFEVVDTITEDPAEREKYGEQYLHIGDY